MLNMNGIEIERILFSYDLTSDIFQGVFSSDKLPEHPCHYPYAIIVNTDVSSGPGEHWVSFYFESKNEMPEYFDSYGLPPLKLSFQKFLKKKFLFSSKLIQDIFSYVCGEYAIYFIIQKVLGQDMQKIISSFTNDTKWNDTQVSSFVYNLKEKINSIHQCKNQQFFTYQSCVSLYDICSNCNSG